MPAPPPNRDSRSPAPAPARRRWAWWKRILLGLGLFLLLLIVFYQPILCAVVPLAARAFGAKEHLKIDFKMGGTVFTGLRIENLRVEPTAPGPIEKCRVGLLELHYSLLTLVRQGLNSAFIEDVTLHDADIVYAPGNSAPSPPKKKEPFSLPPLPFPTRLSLRNVSFLMRPAPPETAKAAGRSAAASSNVPAPVSPLVSGATTATVDQGLLVSRLNLELDPDRAGELRLAELRIPGGPDLKDVAAATSYRDRDLQLANLTLSPEIHFRTLSIDGSKLDQKLLGVSLDADLFQGHADATVQLQGIGTPPKAEVQVNASAVSLAAIHDFLKLDFPLSGSLDQVAIRFSGASDQPRSWTGRLDAHLAQPSFGTIALDEVVLGLALKDGHARVERADVSQGANHVALRATVELAAKMEDLPRSTGRGTLQVAAPDFTKLPVKLPMEIDGALTAGGEFALANGKLTTNLKGHVQDLRVPAQQASVTGVDIGIDLTKTLPEEATAPPVAPNAPPPPAKPFFDGLQTHVALAADEIQYADYRIDAVKLALGTEQANAKLESLEITRGGDHVHAAGSYVLPADFAAWQKNPLDVQLNIDAPQLSEFFVSSPGGPLVQGQLTAKGNVTLRNGIYDGGFHLTAANVQAKGARLDSADVQIDVADNQATIRSGSIRFDDKNAIDLSGHAALAAPYAFDAGVTVDLPDLSRFAPALRANNILTPIAGSFHAVARGSGHLATAPGRNDQQIAGALDVTARNVQAEGATIPSVDTSIVVADNEATINTGEIKLDAKSAVTFSGQAHLAAPYTYTGKLNADLPDLGTLTPILLAHGVTGKVGGAIHLAVQGAGKMASAPQANDQALDGTVDLTGNTIEVKGLRIEKIDGHLVAADNQATIKAFQVRFDDKNTIDLGGDAGLQAPFAYHANLNVQLQDLKTFLPVLKAAQTPTASGKVGAVVQGKKAVVANPEVRKAASPGMTPLTAQQRAAENALATTKAGQLALAARARQELNQQPGLPPEPKLAGSFAVQWQAAGNFAQDAAGPRFSGGGKIKAQQIEVNAQGPVEADIEGQYSQTDVNFPVLFISSNGLELRSTIALKDALARIDNIHLRQGQTELLAGYLQVPLDLQRLSAPAGPVPDVDKIDINIASKPLSLATLFAGFDKSKPAPVTGTVELSVLAHGSLSKVLAEVKLQGKDLRGASTPKLSSAGFDVDLVLRDNRLSLDAAVRQPQIQPITLKGNIPLDLATIASNKRLDPNSPVSLIIEQPRSSLALLAQIVPAVHFVQGDVGMDIKVGGTLEHPIFNGSAEMDIPAVRAEDITVPALRNFQAKLVFSDKQLRFDHFGGEIGGGKFSLEGHIDFNTLTEPILQLEAKAANVLAMRDDNITVRLNADVKVTGPLAGATVAGKIGITNSRYLKDIDIVPLNLPGKPAPQPPAPAEAEPSISIKAAPIDKWKFDLAIKTDDPFYIRGNLATGSATVDLRLRGTGLQPLLDGSVSVEHLVATLPFSRLEINNGNVAFTPDQPLNPVLNLTGTSQVDNYLITLFISGRAKAPTILFTSEPPLAQEQIVSLLVAGVTTDQLASNSEALAGKATLLVLQDLYRRTFKKKAAPADAEPKSTLADRVSLNLGEVDPETGKQQAGATFKFSDTVQFVADFGIAGDLQGRVKYLIRFH